MHTQHECTCDNKIPHVIASSLTYCNVGVGVQNSMTVWYCTELSTNTNCKTNICMYLLLIYILHYTCVGDGCWADCGMG